MKQEIKLKLIPAHNGCEGCYFEKMADCLDIYEDRFDANVLPCTNGKDLIYVVEKEPIELFANKFLEDCKQTGFSPEDVFNFINKQI